jgi:hypothetical protein
MQEEGGCLSAWPRRGCLTRKLAETIEPMLARVSTTVSHEAAETNRPPTFPLF